VGDEKSRERGKPRGRSQKKIKGDSPIEGENLVFVLNGNVNLLRNKEVM